MRDTPNNNLWNLWNAGGPFIGPDGATHGRVTVEIGWSLRKGTQTTLSKPGGGSWTRGPARWFQRSNNSQTETELPNVLSIDMDRSVDVDAATCKIVILNTRMNPTGEPISTGTQGESLGQPGFYWPFRGDSASEETLWGWGTNTWNDVLQPNALIRTYQGYGGNDKTIDQALSDGNLLQTGLWLVDDVNLDAKTGHMTIACRDMMKLLIEQQLYPPLVPKKGSAHYPLNYYRWIYVHHPVIPYGPTVYRTGFQELTSTTPLNNGIATSSFAGHPPSHAKDGDDPDTFWMSGGHLAANNYEYLQFDCPGAQRINGINLVPYGGNYEVWVHVKIGDNWQGSGADPYQGLPFVNHISIGWERAMTIDLKGTDAGYNATKIRLTFGKLKKLGPGPAYFRCGVRDLNIGLFSSTVTAPNRYIEGIARGHEDSTNGYWLCGSDGGVFSFGDLKFHGSESGVRLNGRITGMAAKSGTGKGYRLVAEDGGVFCFGDAYYHGSVPGLINDGTIAALPDYAQGVDICNGTVGATGYYVLFNTGRVFAFGTAVFHGHHILDLNGGLPNALYGCAGMTTAPGVNAYWTVDTAGKVTHHGPEGFSGGSVTGLSGGELAMGIEATSDGGGYWVVTNAGNVHRFGNAPNLPDAGSLNLAGFIIDIVRTHTDNGYWLVGIDGGVFAYGDAPFLGSLPEQYNRVGDGNYEDYLDIVKDLLLWSGWWQRNPTLADPELSPAAVYGNLESTGIFSPDNLTEDFFDKKPVIDVINTIKEIVGYVTYCDEVGAFHFHTPNVWSIGNFTETGVPVRPPAFGGDPDEVATGFTPTMALINENKQIISYQVSVNDTDARSTIIVATDDPAIGNSSTKSVTLTSQWGGELLRGIVRPAMWVNGQFMTKAIQRTMAELIDLHLFMQQRQGTLTMAANPILQVNDQVQIVERTTSETYVHYIRGYSTHMDLITGEYTQTLTTHWMGDGDAWFLSYSGVNPTPPPADSPPSDPGAGMFVYVAP